MDSNNPSLSGCLFCCAPDNLSFLKQSLTKNYKIDFLLSMTQNEGLTMFVCKGNILLLNHAGIRLTQTNIYL